VLDVIGVVEQIHHNHTHVGAVPNCAIIVISSKREIKGTTREVGKKTGNRIIKQPLLAVLAGHLSAAALNTVLILGDTLRSASRVRISS
jgi:hypothetical protein